MTKTIALETLIKKKLDEVEGITYHNYAPDDAPYPYKVYSLGTTNLGDMHRDDIILTISIYDKKESYSSKEVDAIADEVDALFNGSNLPQDTILPTFYRNTRNRVEESDKRIQRVDLDFIIQNYERGE